MRNVFYVHYIATLALIITYISAEKNNLLKGSKSLNDSQQMDQNYKRVNGTKYRLLFCSYLKNVKLFLAYKSIK